MMNIQGMNVELMEIVEAAVRPVLCPHHSKMRMRHELYRQVEEIYKQERCRDPDAALANTRRRFGTPRELSLELQATVPSHQRSILKSSQLLFGQRLLERMHGSSLSDVIGPGLEFGCRATIVFGLYLIVLIILATTLTGNHTPFLIIDFFVAFVLLVGANATLMSYFAFLGHQAIDPAFERLSIRNRRQFVIAAIGAGVIFGMSIELLWLAADVQAFWRHGLNPFLFASAAGTLGFSTTVLLGSAEWRQRYPWDQLAVAEV